MPEDSRKVLGLRAVYHTALCSWASPWSSDGRRDVLLSLGWRRENSSCSPLDLYTWNGRDAPYSCFRQESIFDRTAVQFHFHLLVFSGHRHPPPNPAGVQNQSSSKKPRNRSIFQSLFCCLCHDNSEPIPVNNNAPLLVEENGSVTKVYFTVSLIPGFLAIKDLALQDVTSLFDASEYNKSIC